MTAASRPSATVLGIDSSTQTTKALVVCADTGRVLAEGRAPHPEGTEVDPRAWLAAADTAVGQALAALPAGTPAPSAAAVGGQQHGMVLLDESGEVARDALLWNDTRSAPQAASLTADMGGAAAAVERIGSVPVASFTGAKLRWVAENEPEVLDRAATVLLPHDLITRHLAGDPDVLVTDRGDASGTAYFSTRDDAWDHELLRLATGGLDLRLPDVAAHPGAAVARSRGGAAGTAAGLLGEGLVLAAGTGDNMGAALGLGQGPGDVSVSIGTSGVCAMVSDARPADPTGTVTGFADATGRFLPMTTTINAARILEFGRSVLGVDHDELAALALASVPGAHGVTLLPYLDGERTPNRPDARATLTGMSTATTREDIARACVEGLMCSLADGLSAVEEVTGQRAARILLIGGAARNEAVRAIAPAVFGRPVTVVPAGEYVALGAARQAAWALAGGDEPPAWELTGDVLELEAEATPEVLEAYRTLKERTAAW